MSIYIVYRDMEFTLYSYIQTQKKSMKLIKSISYQLLNVLTFIHSRDIIHRDLKPGNILLSHDYELFLSNFANCRVLQGLIKTI